jgi:DNA polymerase I-like protein with 3'-5' exonuclease and polymerase domains
MVKNQIGAQYLQRLQACYHEISKRGIKVDTVALKKAKEYIDANIKNQCSTIASIWNCQVYIGSANDDGSGTSVNLNASSGSRTPLSRLKDLGYKIPKLSTRDEEGNYISKESLAELALQRMLSENQFGIIGGDPVLRAMLAVRELATLKQRYINANLYTTTTGESVYLSNYNVAGTTTGRRASRKHTFGFGNNAQNFPKHGELADIYRNCLVARRGMVFLSVDQMSAEDWPVSALAQNHKSLEELNLGLDRHKILAQQIFNLSEAHYSEKEWKDSIERYLGKKTRHANNYDMQEQTFADSLAKEGKSFTFAQCKFILDRVNEVDPSIRGIFHEFVRQSLYKNRTLTNPFGRERQFFGMRGGDNGGNAKIFREAFAFIPQSTVADNTGFAVFELSCNYDSKGQKNQIVQEGHDSIIQEVWSDPVPIYEKIQETREAFRRVIVINGISFEIPVEGEIGFTLGSMETLKNGQSGSKRLEDIRLEDVKLLFEKLKDVYCGSGGRDEQ